MVGNTGFTLWRASDLAVALMDAFEVRLRCDMCGCQGASGHYFSTPTRNTSHPLVWTCVRAHEAECNAEVTQQKSNNHLGASDQSATWRGSICQLRLGKRVTAVSKTPLPEVILKYRGAVSADWHTYSAEPRTKERVVSFARGGRPTFTFCPLPYLTHPCGSFASNRKTFEEAASAVRNDTRAQLRVVHANFVVGSRAKLKLLHSLGTWALTEGGAAREWPGGCRAAPA